MKSPPAHPILFRQLDVIGPKAIVCLGATAAQALLKTTDSISRFRGTWFDYRGTKLLATYHPGLFAAQPGGEGGSLERSAKSYGPSGARSRRKLRADTRSRPSGRGIRFAAGSGFSSNKIPQAEACANSLKKPFSGSTATLHPRTCLPPIAKSRCRFRCDLCLPYEIPVTSGGIGMRRQSRARSVPQSRHDRSGGGNDSVPPARPQTGKKSKAKLSKCLIPIPALPPKSVELGRWVGGYYVAPPGEVFRAMLPPEIDLRHEREYLMTEAGRARRGHLDAGGNRSESEVAELALLSLMEIEGRPVRADRVHKLPGGEAAAERLRRRKQLESREVAVRRQARMQKIVAWNDGRSEHSAADIGSSLPEKEARVFHVLAEERGPLPLPQLAKLARVSRPLIERMIRQEKHEMLGRAARR